MLTNQAIIIKQLEEYTRTYQLIWRYRPSSQSKYTRFYHSEIKDQTLTLKVEESTKRHYNFFGSVSKVEDIYEFSLTMNGLIIEGPQLQNLLDNIALQFIELNNIPTITEIDVTKQLIKHKREYAINLKKG